MLLLRFDSLHICLLLLTEFVCRFVLNPACCSKSDADYYRFIGLLFGIAIRTKKPLALHLAPLVWKLIAGIEITMDNLEEVDLAFMQAMRGIRKLSDDITPATFSEARFKQQQQQRFPCIY